MSKTSTQKHHWEDDLGSPPYLDSDEGGVTVFSLSDGRYAVQFGYNSRLVAQMRRLEGADFDKDADYWLVPAEHGATLLEVTLPAMRAEVAADLAAREEIYKKATAIGLDIQRRSDVDQGVQPKVNEFHKQGEASVGEIVVVNSRYTAQFTGQGQQDGAAFLKVHRLADLSEQVFQGDHTVIEYLKGRGQVKYYVPQEQKINAFESSMGRYMAGVKVEKQDDKFVVQFDYNPTLSARIGRIEGAEFNTDKKAWFVGTDMKDQVVRAVHDMRIEVAADRDERESLVALANQKIDGAKVTDAFTKEGQAYTGKVLAVSERYALQHTGKEYATLHRARSLGEAPVVGANLRVEYGKNSRATMTDKGVSRAANER